MRPSRRPALSGIWSMLSTTRGRGRFPTASRPPGVLRRTPGLVVLGVVLRRGWPPTSDRGSRPMDRRRGSGRPVGRPVGRRHPGLPGATHHGLPVLRHLLCRRSRRPRRPVYPRRRHRRCLPLLRLRRHGVRPVAPRRGGSLQGVAARLRSPRRLRVSGDGAHRAGGPAGIRCLRVPSDEGRSVR